MKRFPVRALISADLRNVGRDELLLLSFLAPVLMLIVLRLGVPLVTDYLHASRGFDLRSYYGVILAAFMVLPPMMFGMVVGFILLDEGDEGLLQYVAVTPLGRKGLLGYRIAAGSVVTGVFAYAFAYGAGLIEVGAVALLPAAVLLALEAPLYALFIAGVARNKVEGLAYSKVLGVSIAGPIVAFLIADWWRYAVGWLPAFWVGDILSIAFENGPPRHLVGSAVAGFVVHGVLLMLLLRRFVRR